MKLVDILARELKVWPEGAFSITQDYDLEVNQVMQDCTPIISDSNRVWRANPGMLEISFFETKELAGDYATAIVTRAEWQAAVDALKVPKVVDPIIEWSTAPEGTTHFFECGSGSHWRKISGADFYAWAHEDWQLIAVPATITEYIARPEEQEAEIARMLDIINASSAGGSGKAAARALYKAGYRNQVAP